jgi:hypothetical protein
MYMKFQVLTAASMKLPVFWLNIVVEWLTLLLRVREVSASILGPETGYPD